MNRLKPTLLTDLDASYLYKDTSLSPSSAWKPPKSLRSQGLKKCIKCREKKSLDDFPKAPERGDGYQSYCRACKNELHRKRRESSAQARLKHHMSTRIASQLGVHAPAELTKNLEKYLGYTLTALVNALSKDLRDREGIKLRDALKDGYHVDHIRPLSSFKVINNGAVDWDTFQECWCIDNLRAISAEENLAKGAKRTHG